MSDRLSPLEQAARALHGRTYYADRWAEETEDSRQTWREDARACLAAAAAQLDEVAVNALQWSAAANSPEKFREVLLRALLEEPTP